MVRATPASLASAIQAQPDRDVFKQQCHACTEAPTLAFIAFENPPRVLTAHRTRRAVHKVIRLGSQLVSIDGRTEYRDTDRSTDIVKCWSCGTAHRIEWETIDAVAAVLAS